MRDIFNSTCYWADRSSIFIFRKVHARMHTWTSQKSATPNVVKLVSSVSLQWYAIKLLSPTSLPQQYAYKMARNWLFHPKLHSVLTGINNMVSQSFLGLCTFTVINNVYYRLHACAVSCFNCNQQCRYISFTMSNQNISALKSFPHT